MKTYKNIEEIIDRFDKLFDNRMFDAPSIKAHIKHFFREELTAYIKQREREAYDKGWEERWSHEIGKLIKGIDKNLPTNFKR